MVASKNLSTANLYTVDFTWNGGLKMEVVCAVWADSPDPANEIAIKKWKDFDASSMDTCDNIDGKRTPKGKCYDGFACLNDGQSSLMISVGKVIHTYGFKQNWLKKILTGRGFNFKEIVKGLKGAQATRALADTLKELLPQEEKEKPSAKEEQELPETKDSPITGKRNKDEKGNTEEPSSKKQKIDE